jgi:tungstate transport system substrate-binding protein
LNIINKIKKEIIIIKDVPSKLEGPNFMNHIHRIFPIFIIFILLTGGVIIAGCTTTNQTVNQTADKPKLLLATTTSLYDTGLLNYLEPKFEAKYNVDLLITSQGTGKAIELAKKGDADVLLVHSPSQELTFVNQGYGINRRTFAYNYFIIVGPSDDPAGIKGMSPEDAFRKILEQGKSGNTTVVFVSRGDGSGTHSAEQKIWANAKFNYTQAVQKSGKWYIESGKGMGETLQMASEKGAYTITDEGTFLAYAGKLNIVPVISQGASLLNLYSVITVYNEKQPVEKITMANNFINFLISPDTMADIGNYGKEKYGKGLFTPMTNGVPPGVTADFTTPAGAIRP